MDSKEAKTAASYQAALHSVQQKQLSKTWKKPDHQSPAPKVYRVDPRGFRDLVQQLTGATSSSPSPPTPPPPVQSRPLRDTAPAPPPLNLAPRQAAQEYAADLLDDSGSKDAGGSSTGFMDLLSPSFFSGWWPPLHGQGSQEGLEA